MKQGKVKGPFLSQIRKDIGKPWSKIINWERVLLAEDSEILKKMVLEKLDNVQTGYYAVARIARNSVSGSWRWACVLFLRQPGALSPNAWLSHLLAKIKTWNNFWYVVEKENPKMITGFRPTMRKRGVAICRGGEEGQFFKVPVFILWWIMTCPQESVCQADRLAHLVFIGGGKWRHDFMAH